MKKVYSFGYLLNRALVLLLAAFLITSTQAQNITSGLKLHYTFDDVTAITVPDASGNGQTGMLQGEALIVEGKTNQAVQLTVKSDYVSLPENIGSSWSSFTFATWVKLSELKNATRFFDLGNGTDGNNNFIAFIPSYGGDNQFMCVRFRPSSGTAVNALSTTKLPLNQWVHVAFTYKWDDIATSATGTIYINGTPAGVTNNMPYNPSVFLGTTANNYLGYSRWGQDGNGFNGLMDDVRFYDRALTSDDIMTLNGYSSELINAWKNLDLGNLNEVISNINLPTDLGNGITVNWASSREDVISTTGVVSRPDQFDAVVKLTASITQQINGNTYTLAKEFTANVLAFNLIGEQIAIWTFEADKISVENGFIKVKDATSNEFTGTVMNDASIRTIGETEQFNVLDLGNGTGYFDMGTDIGKAIYALNDYTMFAYFYIDESYSALTSNGNFIWTFSNTDNAPVDQNGYVIGRLNAQAVEITPSYYASGNQAVSVGAAASKGSWHHFCYTQQGTTAKIFVDGVEMKSGTITHKPSTTIALPGRTGTLYNWLGRANYPSDVYLRQTLLYDFQLLRIPVNADDLVFGFEVPAVLDRLNAAYAENPNFKDQSLINELNNLDISNLGDLNALTSSITLPTQGSLDPGITISWVSSAPQIISNTGEVNRPDYYNFNVVLTAVLSKGPQSVSKEFNATVLVKPGTEFTGDLIVKHDFTTINDRNVTDKGEKQLVATLMNEATVRTIGTAESGTFNVLDLGNGTGYLDLGAEVGKVMYHLEDYTLSAYYRIDSEYTGLSSNGNFIWTFSNTANAMANPIGYIIGSLKNQSNSITAGFYTAESGNQAVGFGTEALKGEWHHIAYVQNGTNGIVYIDGMPMANAEISNLPKTVLPKSGLIGTPYNWVGRSCYTGDVYLRNTLVADFRLYKKALTDEEIQTTVLNVGNTMGLLEAAYEANPNIPSGLINITNSPYSIGVENDGIRIIGLKGSEKVAVFDISGREVKHSNAAEIATGKGIWIVKIDNYVSKVIVK